MATTTDPGIAFPSWSTGSNTSAVPYGHGNVRRVTTDDDISVRDINELRLFIEALSIHSHDYTDNIGSC